MPVQSRIKIIQVSSLEEVESKVNDFLAFDEHIQQLVHIDYRLESNFVIIEYYVMNPDRRDNNNKKSSSLDDLMFINGWWKLYFPFSLSYG
jgi:hypothetical protein